MRRGKPHAAIVPRDWTPARAKVEREGRCRVCPATVFLQAAHVIGRRYDPAHPHPRQKGERIVMADAVVPLCPTCHDRYDTHQLNLLDHLTDAEYIHAVDLVGAGQARRRIMGAAWRGEAA